MSDLSAAAGSARPATADGAKAFIVTPFTRLARTHAAATMADAMVAASLAGSLFFNLPPGDARAPVLRYLVITMLPFAIISPLIGPAIDRLKGGHRFMVIGSLVARVLVCYFMISKIGPASEKHAAAAPVAAFFLLAICILASQKAYQVARSALVPTVVDSDEALVEANSKLSLISGISGIVGVFPAAILLKGFGPEWSVGLAMITYLVATFLATRIPKGRIATESADATERHELRGAGIVMAGSAMGLIRAAVGFLTLLIAFDFRGGGRPAWQFALVGALSVASQQVGAVASPRIRKFTSEENLLTGVLALLVMAGIAALIMGDVAGAAALGIAVGFAAGAGKLAFDSILQRDAPDANRGRAFAKFETRFQVTWVIGALVPVVAHLSAHWGFGLIFVLALVALGSYVIGRLAHSHRMGHNQNAATAAAVEIEDRFNEVSEEFKGRLATGSRSLIRRIRGGEGEEPQPEGGPAGGTGSPGPYDHTPPTAVAGDVLDEDLARTSRVAWQPPAEEPPLTDYPWEAPAEAADVPGAFLDDVDPSVSNPFPWSPDEPTRHAGSSPARVPDHDAPTAPADPGRTTRRHFRPGSPVHRRRRS